MKKRILSFLLATLMLGSFVACTQPTTPPAVTDGTTASPTEENTTAQVTEPDTEQSFDWSTWEPAAGADVTELSVSGTVAGSGGTVAQTVTHTFSENNADFGLQNADAEGTRVTLRKGEVSALNYNTALGSPVSYSAKLQITGRKVTEPWFTLYIGLRLPNPGSSAEGKGGIWIALRENQIGLRTGDWPLTSYMDIKAKGVNFKTERMLWIEDSGSMITVYAENDSSEKVALAEIKWEGDTVSMYHPGESTPTLTDSGVTIPESGYVNFWLHLMSTGDTFITDFTATGIGGPKETADDANMMNSKDVLTDTWVSVDDVGRVSGTDNGAVNDKKVGIFYFLWHDPIHADEDTIYDHTKAYYEGGQNALINVLSQGSEGFGHYWAEPYFGYYRSDDEWIIRKHAYQLMAAGIDFIFIDATNGITYENTYETLLRVWSEMRAEGHNTPQICFHCGDDSDVAAGSYKALWKNLYSTGRYEDLWFKYNGKPLIFLPYWFYKSLPEEQQDFFTSRRSWANTNDSWYTYHEGKACWPWADMYPQSPGLSETGEVEQMVVMSGFWANGSYGTNAGRSYSYKNGGQPGGGNFGFDLVEQGTSGLGIAFEEQFDYAIEQDPGLIMLVGWNEWWAGRWEAGGATGQTIANTYKVTNDNNWTRNYYVDAFNPEYSRDIEPVKGLFNDNYYYQMVQNIRQYKGSRAPLSAFGQRPIDMAGVQSQWDMVGPEFRDYVGDIAHRDHMSYVGQIHYTNETGRNDLATAKVSRYGDDVWFYIECAAAITAPEGTNWMNLYVNADCKQETGWYGYDYVINRDRDGSACSIMKFSDGKWEMTEIGRADYVVNGKYMVIKLDAEALGLGDTFDFKWADNSVDDGDIMQFIDLGDTAPNDRFNYRYTTTETEQALPETLTSDMVVLKAGSYFAFVGGEMVRLDETTTKATFFGDEDHLYLLFEFAKANGLAKDGDKTYNHYGVAYVDITSTLESCGKTVTRDEDMLVLADKALTEDELLILYRALY